MTAESRTEVAAAAGRSACGDCREGGKDGLGERLRHRSTPARATAAEEEAGEGGGGCLGSEGGGSSGQAAAAVQQRKKRVEEEAEVGEASDGDKVELGLGLGLGCFDGPFCPTLGPLPPLVFRFYFLLKI